MTQDMVLNKRYSKITVLLLLLLLMAAGNSMAQVVVGGSVYGGGKLADVKGNTEVKMAGGSVAENVFGGGKGQADTYDCEKAMVGVNNAGADQDLSTNENKNKGTKVTISDGTVNGSVYGGGEVGRVEWNTQVTLGVEGQSSGDSAPVILGDVFGAGAGVDTHGYSALVRGNCTVIIQGKTRVKSNVYGGGKMATAGRYWVKTETHSLEDPSDPAPEDLPNGMPYKTKSGGECIVTIKDYAEIGPDGTATETEGNVFGAAKGVVPDYHYDPDDIESKANWSKRMVTYSSTTHVSGEGTTWDYYPKDNRFVWEYFTTKAKYLEFLQTLGLSTTTNVTIDGEASIKGTVYGGGELGDVKGAIIADEGDVKMDAKVVMNGGTVDGNIFGGGKGLEDTFECEKAMVGVDGAGVKNPDGGIEVIISSGTVGGNVYGGGEVGRVEKNTVVTIGEGDGNAEGAKSPVIGGYVFGAGAGKETHGYSALVRGNCTVTVQGNAKVEKNVYGGGQKATAGRYWISGVTYPTELNAPSAPAGLPPGMPYATRGGGKCFVTVKGHAQIGPTAATETAGHVFGAGMGITPAYFYDYDTSGDTHKADWSKRMATYDSETYKNDDEGKTWDYSDEKDHRFVWEYFTTKTKYFDFLQTLALVTEAQVTIDESANVKGNIYGGSQSGFVQDNATVRILDNSTCEIGTTDSYGNVFGGGKGLENFAEAGKVKGNTTVSILSGSIYGNVYGGGELGDVGTIDKTDQTNYNYTWKQINGSTANVAENNKITGTNNNTGICTVNITGGTIGVSGTVSTKHGNVFGAGQGTGITWWCEKAMVYSTKVYVQAGTIHGTVYGGGEIGRVGDDAKVTIGLQSDPGEGSNPDIKGDVYGAGAGLETHGYSALLRGNTEVTIQGIAQVGGSVYGGGKTASVGKFTVVGGLPTKPEDGGTCIVNVKDKAKIGPSGTGHNVFGACKGVTPAYNNIKDDPKRSKSMQLLTNAPEDTNLWSYYNNDVSSPFIWRYYATEADYLAFLETLALTSHPHVTIGGTWTPNETTGTISASGTPTVFGSVYGGGERGLTLGNVDVNIVGGTVEQDVYGGGALADTNKGNWDVNGYVVANVSVDDAVDGLYTLTGTEYKITEDEFAKNGTTYYRQEPTWAHSEGSAFYKTTVDLTGGLIKGDAYGGGLGQKNGFNGKTENIPAVVWGDIAVTLNGTAFDITKYQDEGYTDIVKSGRVFGCNNLLGSPQGDVTVTVWKTVSLDAEGVVKAKPIKETNIYEVAAVYGGGNLAPYEASGKKAHVIINGCSLTSIQTVYGGGNAAPVPETDVDVNGTYEIGAVFGGGNGKDKYKNDTGWKPNPGANVNGNANTMIFGGTVHEAFGGSNEKGTIYGDVSIDVAESGLDPEDPASGYCDLDVGKLVGAGKNADVNGNLKIIMGCKPDVTIPLVFGGADNANVNGNVELTVTSGKFGNIVGGNNNGGRIKGHIIVNIEETTCIPLNIDHLYLCGYNALYSQYGYYVMTEETEAVNGTGKGDTNETAILQNGKLQLVPRESANDPHLPVDTYSYSYNETTGEVEATWTVLPITGEGKFEGYAPPVLNVTSCTSIGEVFGGGYGTTATVYGNPTVNINMIPGAHADEIDRDGDKVADGNDNALGAIGDVYGGGDAAAVYGNTTVNIGTETTVQLHESISREGVYTMSKPQDVKGAYITGNVYGGGDNAIITGDTEVNICTADYSSTANFVGFSINNSVYGGGCNADVLGNTNVTMSGGYVFNGIFGGGYAGSVGTFNRSPEAAVGVYGHTAHKGCIGKPISCAENTGKCTVVVNGGQIGPIEVATEGMNRPDNEGGPVPQGWVWGGGCGIVEDPSADPDTHFKTYVNNTDVTIKGNAFILESIIGGGEFGRVLGNTLVKIEGGQIGVGENKVTDGKPVAYTEAQWTEAEEAVKAGSASRINAIAEQMPACSHLPYGRNDGTNWVYDTYDPYADEWKTAHSSDKYPGGSTDNASDGKTWIGCVFAGGSGYMPFVNRNSSDEITDYNWVPSAGWVEGNAEVRITGGHILTNVYGGNEYTDVKGKCTVKMSGGSVGVPLSLSDKWKNPMTGNIYGAGKGDPRVNFNKVTNVKDVEVEITGGIVYGSVYGGGEDGHVLRDVTITIGKQTTTEGVTTSSGPTIGTWGTTYVDGNIFGGGRGFSGEAYTAGNVAGSVKLEIKGGQILGSVYGGGRMASVGYGLFDAITNGQTTPGYGEMRADSDTETGFNSEGFFTKGRGHIDITISGGTIGNSYEYIYNPSDALKSSTMPLTEFDSDNRLKHTKGGNVFAGGMGNLYEQNGTTFIHIVDWWRLGCVKSTKLTITGGTIKSCIYGGGELGQVVGYHTTKNAADQDINVGTEVIINGGTIGTEVTENDVTQYTFGSVFGGGYGSLVEVVGGSYPKYIAGRVKAGTKVNMTAGSVLASVYGGGEMAAVGESKTLGETLTTGHSGDTYVSVSGGTVGIAPITISDSNRRYFGGAKMGNVYGGGSGHGNTVRSGHVYGNTNVTISAGSVSGEPRIYHNIYGGGAYGSVGDFTYQTGTDAQTGTQKVFGVEGLNTAHTNSGVARVTITGGTIGYDGKENGMVFGSSRGDINRPGERDDHTAWTYDTHVTIGTAGTPAIGTEGQEGYVPATSATDPKIKGTVYGSGENGHVFNDTEVTIHGGTIGIDDSTDPGYKVTSNGIEYSGAEYPYRGNVYGGGCGTDMYYSGSIPDGHTAHDGGGDMYNSLAGIVYGNATVNITGGRVVRNVYGAGAMGSVTGRAVTTTANNVTTTTYIGGTTTINISGGTVGVDGNNGDGNVFGAARGNATTTQTDVALVKTTNVTVSNGTVKGNVYGGGETGDVQGNTTVAVQGGTIAKNVFGGGQGSSHNFECDKAMVGVVDDGEDKDPDSEANKDKGTTVTISNGTVGTLDGDGKLVEGTGNVYGGGELGRVEWNTQVKIGVGTGEGTFAPDIKGSVFAAGAGVKTHGYSALVRGNSTVTVQGDATIGKSVYGGGKAASVGRYWVNKPGLPPEAHAPDPAVVPYGRPFALKSGGRCTVIIGGNAEIGTDGATGGTEEAGNVFAGSKGVEPVYTGAWSMGSNGQPIYYNSDTYGDNYKKEYLAFLKTLAVAARTIVTIDGGLVKGSVYGGGELGDVGIYITDNDGYNIYPTGVGISTVTITGGKVGLDNNTDLKKGNVFGAGKGLDDTFECEKAMLSTTSVTISNGTVNGSVYGGGEIGRVENNTEVTIGLEHIADGTTTYYQKENETYNGVVVEKGNSVVGYYTRSGKEEPYVYTLIEASAPIIAGNVFGAGAGKETHGYSALVRGNPTVTIQGSAKVGKNVYGGGEIATAGRYEVIGGIPIRQLRGGECTVIVQGNAEIGPETATDKAGHVFGAGKGVDPTDPDFAFKGTFQKMGPTGQMDEITTESDYLSFLTTLALSSHTYVTIDGEAKVNGNVYGGSESGFVQNDTYIKMLNGTIGPENTTDYGNIFGGGLGVTGFDEAGMVKGNTTLDIYGGTINGSVYGGGALSKVVGSTNVNIGEPAK